MDAMPYADLEARSVGLERDLAGEPLERLVLPGAPRKGSGPRPRYRRISIAMAALDALCIIDALLLSYLVRWGLEGMPGDYLAVVAVAPVVWIGVLHSFSLYSTRHLSAWEEFRRIISSVSVGMVILILASFWSHSSYSRIWVGLTWIFALVFELMARRMWRAHIHRLRREGHLTMRTLVVGTNQEAIRLADRLSRPGSGFSPIGHVAVGGSANGQQATNVVADLEALPDAIAKHAVDCLMIATTSVREEEMLASVQAARQEDAEVWVSANLPQVLTSRLRIQPIEDVLTLSLRPVSLSGVQGFAKRVFDIAIATFLLILTLPLLAVVAVAVVATSKGPAFYRQERVTKGGKAFVMYKFRTMRADADRILEAEDIDPSAPFFKLGVDDPRLTSVGRLLRKTSLDELPQLLNVLKGEMSLVGPRPLPVEQVAEHLELLGPRHEVPAGMTGWWQIQGRSDVGPEESVRLDLFYIENWSLSLDVFILLKTIGAVLVKRGAY